MGLHLGNTVSSLFKSYTIRNDEESREIANNLSFKPEVIEKDIEDLLNLVEENILYFKIMANYQKSGL
ncbi:MAG: hypothetical protein HFJ20_04990 [Clostridia bacterium]|nr:hypothetical protein [Clostridia bacterium]